MEDCCLANMTDTEITWLMRKNNFEKFKTLVRMHLSFELDLNTDEFDLPNHDVIYYEKGKMKKWNRLSRKIKSCTTGKTNTSPNVGTTIVLDDNFIRHLQQLKMFILMDKNVVQEGIFRKTGSVSRQNELRDFVCNDKSFDLSSGYTVHDCATVLKSFLADLHEPVLTDAHYPAHCQIAPLFQVGDIATVAKNKEAHILNSIQLLLLLLPNENRILFQDIIEMLHTVSTFQDKNKMSSENLATLFAPHLICPRNLPPEALHYIAQTMFPIIAYMITKGSIIFQIPAKLSTDIRVYYHEQKRKTTMSPEQTLDDSISDMSTVNTVYTFVDREKTAAAHTANNTDTELAQLYAHIQSLPESSKKRRLIKQFNKQNGQGTPLQLLVMNRKRRSETSKSAKSISDSIKKHIFQKGIISRTPKRSEMSINTQTPVFSTKNSKLRVLFRSPILNSSSTNSSSVTLSDLSPSKTHTLQKSFSSSSLTLRTSLSKPHELEYICFPISQFANAVKNDYAVDDKHLVHDRNKRTVAWKDEDLKLLSPLHNNNIDVNVRYKSEPNLSQIFQKKPKETLINKTTHSRKVKGVSMGNLDVSFSSQNKRRLKYSAQSLKPNKNCGYQNDESIREDILICEAENYFENKSDRFVECSTHRLNLHRNYDLLTSTPSTLLGRRSMSPITKSTQRMPKAMQESIMTPRSRKPVMLTNNMGISEQTPKNCQSSTCYEQEKDAFVCKKTSENSFVKSENTLKYTQNYLENKSLSNGFREYLLSRRLVTASPEDASFSSQPDDFKSTQDIDELNESQLSTSLMRCLDGHHPAEGNDIHNTVGEFFSVSNSSCRKRIAVQDDGHKLNEIDNMNDKSFLLTKKGLIDEYNENPGETSF